MEFNGVHEENVDITLTPSERSSNFNINEIEKLKKLINKYSKVILNKKTNGLSIKQKDETWEVIAKEFNSSSNTYRSVKQLKCKWEYIKKRSRKEAGKVNRMRRQTGGGPPPPSLSTTDEWVTGIESKNESTLIHLREEKCRLEMDLLKKSFDNDEKRKQELHELQVIKIKLEIDILSMKTE